MSIAKFCDHSCVCVCGQKFVLKKYTKDGLNMQKNGRLAIEMCTATIFYEGSKTRRKRLLLYSSILIIRFIRRVIIS